VGGTNGQIWSLVYSQPNGRGVKAECNRDTARRNARRSCRVLSYGLLMIIAIARLATVDFHNERSARRRFFTDGLLSSLIATW
jgi:hypothetical protein